MTNASGGLSSNWPRKKQVTTMNCRISTVMYFESRPLTSRPHLRDVSNDYKTGEHTRC